MNTPITQAKLDKQIVQDALLGSMMHAFLADDLTESQLKQMDKQARRIERLFGFVPGSWVRGG